MQTECAVHLHVDSPVPRVRRRARVAIRAVCPSGRNRRRAVFARIGAAALVVAAAAMPADAATEPRFLGVFADWSAYVVESGAGKHCFAYSEPTDSRGNYRSRGRISVTISHRPGDRVNNEISLTAGYTFLDGSDAEITIDGSRKFVLPFTDGGSAWARDDDDRAIRAALQRGAKMVVRGRSSRGTLTTDVYSLSGVTAALERIDQECGV